MVSYWWIVMTIIIVIIVCLYMVFTSGKLFPGALGCKIIPENLSELIVGLLPWLLVLLALIIIAGIIYKVFKK